MDIFERLTKALTAPGAESGFADVIKEYFKEKNASFCTDALGNLIVKTGKDENGKKIAVFVPMDAPGLVVTYIEDDGRVKVAPLGKCDYRSAAFSRVTNGNVTGVLLPSGADSDSVDKSYVNFGFKDRSEAEKELSEGDVLYFEGGVTKLKNGRFCGAGLGIKAVSAAVCKAYEKLSSDKSVCFVFCTQSELAGRGAYPAAFGIKPDIALCIAPYNGKNFSVKVLDKTLVCDRELTEKLYSCAEKYAENTGRYVSASEMSDAAKVQSASTGVRVAAVMFPIENAGTLAEAVTTENIDALAGITAEFLNNI